jgi:hypothetical protein
MKTITLDVEMNFTDAVQYLLDGKCIGIRPKGNSNFVVKYKPDWMNQISEEYLLCWNRTVKDGKGNESIRTNQYLKLWSPVVIDTNYLPDNINKLFILENISELVASNGI